MDDPSAFDWNDVYSGTAEDFRAPDALILEVLASLPAGHALDVGCGAGGLLLAAKERGWEVHGIDIASRAVEAAKTVFEQRGLEGTFEVADATEWKPPRLYDLVTNSFALPMTLAEQGAAFRTMRSAVAPGGTVVIKDFDPQMSRLPHFAGIDMITVEALTGAFEGFEILRAEVVETPVHHGDADPDDTWTASLLVARRPA